MTSPFATMDALIPNLRTLHLALDAAERRVAEFSYEARKAFELYDAAIDNEEPYAERNRLYSLYQDKLDALKRAMDERDAIKATIIAMNQ